jgi:hypothetical protein
MTPDDDFIPVRHRDRVPVYRVTPILTAEPNDVLMAVQEWWDSLPVNYGTVEEHLTWKNDGCTFDLTIKSNEPEPGK